MICFIRTAWITKSVTNCSCRDINIFTIPVNAIWMQNDQYGWTVVVCINCVAIASVYDECLPHKLYASTVRRYLLACGSLRRTSTGQNNEGESELKTSVALPTTPPPRQGHCISQRYKGEVEKRQRKRERERERERWGGVKREKAVRKRQNYVSLTFSTFLENIAQSICSPTNKKPFKIGIKIVVDIAHYVAWVKRVVNTE